MININKDDYIAEGKVQKCYIHPSNRDLCVKVCKSKIENTPLSYELKYLERIGKTNVNRYDYQFFAKYYGAKPTNLGMGYLFLLIRDETTNEISKTLEEYIQLSNPIISDSQLNKGLVRLKQQMIKHKIIVNDLASKNICCKILKDQTIELIIIDGIGHTDVLPIVNWSGFFAKKKIERRFTRRQLNSAQDQ